MRELAASTSLSMEQQHMAEAMRLARQAAAAGEVPVGAVVVLEDKIIGHGYNQTIFSCDPTAHAEIVAIRAATQAIDNHRLCGASLYVTLEPCIMCAGAILQARIARLVYAAADEKFGAAGSALNLLESPFLNHQCKIVAGVFAEPARQLLKEFFVARRACRTEDTDKKDGKMRYDSP